MASEKSAGRIRVKPKVRRSNPIVNWKQTKIELDNGESHIVFTLIHLIR